MKLNLTFLHIAPNRLMNSLPCALSSRCIDIIVTIAISPACKNVRDQSQRPMAKELLKTAFVA